MLPIYSEVDEPVIHHVYLTHSIKFFTCQVIHVYVVEFIQAFRVNPKLSNIFVSASLHLAIFSMKAGSWF